jgi:hypothetical protein
MSGNDSPVQPLPGQYYSSQFPSTPVPLAVAWKEFAGAESQALRRFGTISVQF